MTDYLDRICKRQTARFLDHLRDTGQATDRLERDVKRMMSFTFRDVKDAIHESCTEQIHAQQAKL